MSIAMATRGFEFPLAARAIPAETYSPVLSLDIVLVLRNPMGLLVRQLPSVSRPSGFSVQNTVTSLKTPSGFVADLVEYVYEVLGFEVEKTGLVAPPMGFAVEDI